VIVRDTTRARIRMRVRDVIPAMMREKRRKWDTAETKATNIIPGNTNILAHVLFTNRKERKKNQKGGKKPMRTIHKSVPTASTT
jgi:hypothetical protein